MSQNADYSFVVAIINHNTRDDLRKCLASLDDCLEQVVVFDNNSTDGSAEMVRREFPRASVIASTDNLGYGAAANRAFSRHAAARDADVLIVSNSDIIFSPGSIAAMVDDLRRHPEAGLNGPRLLNTDGSLQASCFPLPGGVQWLFDNDAACALLRFVPFLRRRLLRLWKHDGEREVAWVKGALLGIRRSAYEQVGGFDESFFMYYEETDLCLRLAKHGWRIRFTPAAEVIHVGGTSTAKVRSAMAVQLFASTIQFARLHYSRLHATLLLWLWRVILLIRLTRDGIRLKVAGGRAANPELAENVQAWRRALTLRFDKAAPAGSAVPSVLS